jgi:predicted DNA-binding transcriptional regulator YafY
MDVRDKLVQATETAEVLEIIYHGGSQPGKSRKIAPISVKDGKVRARCYSSNAVKVFNLDKIELAVTQSSEEWEAGRVEPIQYNSLSEIYDQNVEQLKQLGWHVIISDSELTLHRVRKNGNPLKGRDVQLYYEEYSSDLVVGLDGELREENVRKRSRPFGVRAKNFETKTFSTLDKAAPIFMAQAKKLSPESKQI